MKSLKVISVVLFSVMVFASTGFAQTDSSSIPAAVSEFQRQNAVTLRVEVSGSCQVIFDDLSGVLVSDQFVLTVASPLLEFTGGEAMVIIRSKDKILRAQLASYMTESGIALFVLSEKVQYSPFRFSSQKDLEDPENDLYLVTDKDIFSLSGENWGEVKIEKGAMIIDEKGQLSSIVAGVQNGTPKIIPWKVFQNFQKAIDEVLGKNIKEIGFDKI